MGINCRCFLKRAPWETEMVIQFSIINYVFFKSGVTLSKHTIDGCVHWNLSFRVCMRPVNVRGLRYIKIVKTASENDFEVHWRGSSIPCWQFWRNFKQKSEAFCLPTHIDEHHLKIQCSWRKVLISKCVSYTNLLSRWTVEFKYEN